MELLSLILSRFLPGNGECPAILTAMKQRMLTRSRGGFTTYLVLRTDSNGTFTVANAGHISPYLQGEELPVGGGGGPRLGLSADTTYDQFTFRLN